ncbi:MAG: hypothetical protein ACJA0U_001587 [Salibacteraceae bacterium]|jgi:hypothetical protein
MDVVIIIIVFSFDQGYQQYSKLILTSVFLVGNRLYQVAALRDGSYASDQVIDDFIGSFKLTDENEEG